MAFTVNAQDLAGIDPGHIHSKFECPAPDPGFVPISIGRETDFKVDALGAAEELIPCVDVRTGVSLEIQLRKWKMFPTEDDFLGTHTFTDPYSSPLLMPSFPDDFNLASYSLPVFPFANWTVQALICGCTRIFGKGSMPNQKKKRFCFPRKRPAHLENLYDPLRLFFELSGKDCHMTHDVIYSCRSFA